MVVKDHRQKAMSNSGTEGKMDEKEEEKNWQHIPCRCMTVRNLTMTLEEGRIKTWRLPAFSALLMALSASWRTEVRTILAVF
jgi:hypothetical protein